jgi:hypothetical protein
VEGGGCVPAGGAASRNRVRSTREKVQSHWNRCDDARSKAQGTKQRDRWRGSRQREARASQNQEPGRGSHEASHISGRLAGAAARNDSNYKQPGPSPAANEGGVGRRRIKALCVGDEARARKPARAARPTRRFPSRAVPTPKWPEETREGPQGGVCVCSSGLL